MAGNLQNVTGVSKGLMMYGTEGAGGLASSTNQLVNQLEDFVTCITWELLMYSACICCVQRTFDVKKKV